MALDKKKSEKTQNQNTNAKQKLSATLLIDKLKCVENINEKSLLCEIKKITGNSNYKYLFDVPRQLIDKKKGVVAVLLSLDSENPTLVFVAISKSPSTIRIFKQSNAPKLLVNFAWSFAQVMSLVGTLNAKNQTN